MACSRPHEHVHGVDLESRRRSKSRCMSSIPGLRGFGRANPCAASAIRRASPIEIESIARYLTDGPDCSYGPVSPKLTALIAVLLFSFGAY